MEKSNLTQPKYGKKLILAFLIGTAIFIAVFLLAYNISSYKLQSVYDAQEAMRYNLMSFQVQKELVTDNCFNFNPSLFSDEMRGLGNLLSILELRLGKDNPSVLEQKKTYSLLETQHYLYVKDHNDRCTNNTVPTILFFYSNKLEYEDQGQKMGYMLTYLWENNKTIMIYSFDYDLDSDIITLLKEKYKISRPNVLVINEKTLLNVFDNAEQIKKVMQ